MGIISWLNKMSDAAPIAGYGNIWVYKDGIQEGGIKDPPRYPFKDVTVRIESGDAFRKRVTLTRVVATGIFALAIRKAEGGTSLLTIEGPDFAFVEEVGRKDHKRANEFAAEVRLAARKAESK